jgi:hypothetical protein
MKTYLAEEGGDRSDMRDYGPFSKAANAAYYMMIQCQEIFLKNQWVLWKKFYSC